jgi:hypothetical protein
MPQPSDFLGVWGIIGVGWLGAYGLAWIAVAYGDATPEQRSEGMRLLLHAGVVSVIAFSILLLGSLLRL